MSARIRRWLYQWEGQTSFYQYYATIHAKTCEICLGHHGQIYARAADAPKLPLHSDCRCTLLEFAARELEQYQERGLRMKEKAQKELQRRRHFLTACETLSRASLEDALLRFRQAVDVDIHIEEIETLCAEHAETLRNSPKLASSLRDLFLKAYRMKFETEKYQPMPEEMKLAQQAHGLQTIRELFREYAQDPRGR